MIPLSCWIAATVTPKRAAIELSVSPDLTVYVLVPEGNGLGVPPPALGATVRLGAGLFDGVGVRAAAGVADGRDEGVTLGVGATVAEALSATEGEPAAGDPVTRTDATDADGDAAAPPGADSPRRARAIATKATTRRTMSTAWPPVCPAPTKGTQDGTVDRGRSRRTDAVEGIGR